MTLTCLAKGSAKGSTKGQGMRHGHTEDPNSPCPVKNASKGLKICKIIGLHPKEKEAAKAKIGWELLPLLW